MRSDSHIREVSLNMRSTRGVSHTTCLARVPCEKCAEDTIHKYGVCIHCGTKSGVPDQARFDMWTEQKAKRPRRRRA